MRVLLLLVGLSAPVWAVVPALLGPLAALLEFVPQLLALLLGLFGGMLGIPTWRERLRRHKRLLAVLLLVGLGLLWLGAEHRKPVVAAPPERPLTESWLSFRGAIEGGGGGVLGQEQLPEEPGEVWRHREPEAGLYLSSPVAVNGRVYIGASLLTSTRLSGSVECVNAVSGTLLWRSLARHPVFSSPVVRGEVLYCGEGLHQHQDCRLSCLEAGTGRPLWTFPTHGHIESSPTLVGDRLLFAAGGDGFYCLDTTSGRELWHSQCGHCDSTAAVQENRVFLGTAYGDNAAMGLDLTTGRELWRQKQDLPVWGHPAVDGDHVYFGLGNGTFDRSDPRPRGGVICLQVPSGQQVWRQDLPDSVNTSLVLAGGEVLCGCRDGFVYCLSRADGHIVWKAYCGKPVLASLVLQKESVLVAGGDGRLHELDRADGHENWALRVGDMPCDSSPMLNAGRLYLGAGIRLKCLGR